MTAEWEARLSLRGDKILCGRPTGARSDCGGLIAHVQRNLAGRVDIVLADGDVEIEPRFYGPSKRAAARLADGRRPLAKSPWVRKEKALPLNAVTVLPPFRKLCPVCKTVAFVPVTILDMTPKRRASMAVTPE